MWVSEQKSSFLSVVSFISVLQRYDSRTVVINVCIPFIMEVKICCKPVF